MIFEITEMSAGLVYIRLPVFSAGEAEHDRQGEQNIRRMNAFYESLAGYIKEFAESDAFPAGGRYRAEGRCSVDADGSITVAVQLSLHHRGRCTARRVIRHTWKDGVVEG